MEERQEIVWASALSCLFYFVCDGGKIIRSRLGGLDIRVNITFFKFTFVMFLQHFLVAKHSCNISYSGLSRVSVIPKRSKCWRLFYLILEINHVAAKLAIFIFPSLLGTI
jgi:hypothetical protein